MSTKCCSGDGEGRKDKGGGGGCGDKVAYESWCVTKKDDVCVCVTKLCVKDGVCESGVCVCECGIIAFFCAKCHACHAKRRWMTKCHACDAKRRWMSPSATPAMQRHRRPKRAQARHQNQPSAVRAMPATQNASRCRQVPRLPRKVPRHHRRPKRAQARDQNQPSATPATQNEGGCPQVPRLPRKVPRRHRRPKRAQARHQSQPSATSATPATQNKGGCRQVPRLLRETKVDVPKCHACHAKCRGVTGDQKGPKRATRTSPVP